MVDPHEPRRVAPADPITLPRTWRRLFRFPTPSAARARAEVDDELAFHLAARTDDLVALGRSPEEAAAEARREFGEVEVARQRLGRDAARTARRARQWLRVADLGYDLRHAARALRRAPSFTVVVALTLALGLGANAVMLELLDRLLLRDPAGVVEPERVVRVYGRNGWTALTRSWPDYLDLRGAPGRPGARTLAHVAAYRTGETVARAADAGGARHDVRVQRTTASYFPTVGVRAARGRLYGADEEGRADAARAPVVVLSDRFWARAFDRAPDAVGRTLRVGRTDHRIIGVAPPGFGGVDVAAVDLWTPLEAISPDRGNYGAVHVVARLAPGVALADADRDVNRVNRLGLAAEGLSADEDVMQLGAVVLTQGPAAPQEVRVAEWLGALAALVLLVAVANVAHLLLARGLATGRETAVRAALGAGRARLARQWLAQGVLLAVLGGAAALLVARGLAPALLHLVLPAAEVRAAWALPDLDALRRDGAWRPVAAVLALTLVIGLACGVVPALQAARRDLAAALRGAARTDRGGRGRRRLSGLLLVTQVACTVVLLVGAGLFLRSLQAVRTLDLGFDADRLVVVELRESPDGDARLDPASTAAMLDRLIDRARAVPGVAAVSATHSVPFQSSWRTRLHVPGRDPERWGDEGGGRFNFLSTFVDTAHRATVGLELVAGRWLDAGDRAGGAPVAVVNTALAREVWPAAAAGERFADVLDQCVRIVTPDAPCTRVVGVVRSTRVESVFDDAPGQYYLPLAQARREETASALLVRAAASGDGAPTSADVARTATLVARALGAGLPSGLVVDARPLADAFEPVRQPWVLGVRVLTLFGGLVLLVALMGLYSLVTLLVVERTPEIGVRRALGARGGDLAWLVGRRLAPLLGLGLAFGLALGWAAARAGSALLYGVRPLDGLTYAVVAGGFVLVALLACVGPLRRAVRVSPVTAMRV